MRVAPYSLAPPAWPHLRRAMQTLTRTALGDTTRAAPLLHAPARQHSGRSRRHGRTVDDDGDDGNRGSGAVGSNENHQARQREHAQRLQQLHAHTLALFRYTMRQAERVGTVEPNAVNYYKDNAKEHFHAYADETEPEQIEWLQRRVPDMVAWVLRKFGLSVEAPPASPTTTSTSTSSW